MLPLIDPGFDKSLQMSMSVWLNNCGANTLANLFRDALLKKELDHLLHTKPHQELLNCFKEYYGLKSEEIDWDDIKKLLEQYPHPRDIEVIFANVMRFFIVDSTEISEDAGGFELAYGNREEMRDAKHKKMLYADQLKTTCKRLGFSVETYMKETDTGEMEYSRTIAPVKNFKIFSDEIHWEPQAENKDYKAEYERRLKEEGKLKHSCGVNEEDYSKNIEQVKKEISEIRKKRGEIKEQDKNSKLVDDNEKDDEKDVKRKLLEYGYPKLLVEYVFRDDGECKNKSTKECLGILMEDYKRTSALYTMARGELLRKLLNEHEDFIKKQVSKNKDKKLQEIYKEAEEHLKGKKKEDLQQALYLSAIVCNDIKAEKDTQITKSWQKVPEKTTDGIEEDKIQKIESVVDEASEVYRSLEDEKRNKIRQQMNDNYFENHKKVVEFSKGKRNEKKSTNKEDEDLKKAMAASLETKKKEEENRRQLTALEVKSKNTQESIKIFANIKKTLTKSSSKSIEIDSIDDKEDELKIKDRVSNEEIAILAKKEEIIEAKFNDNASEENVKDVVDSVCDSIDEKEKYIPTIKKNSKESMGEKEEDQIKAIINSLKLNEQNSPYEKVKFTNFTQKQISKIFNINIESLNNALSKEGDSFILTINMIKDRSLILRKNFQDGLGVEYFATSPETSPKEKPKPE